MSLETWIMFGTLIVALGALIIQVRQNNQKLHYTNFLDLLRYYDSLVQKRRETWRKIKDVVTQNQNTKSEIHDKQHSLGYLLIRIEQKEDLYALEHGLLEKEIKSLNLLNELCYQASENNKALRLLILTYASEIAYYQNHIDDLLKLYDHERKVRLFTKPEYESLAKCKVEDYFSRKSTDG